MPHPSASIRLAATLLGLAACGLSHAESSVASSASESVSTSVGSISDSIGKSSNSSSQNKKVAAGDYRVVEVAELAERPGRLRVALQAVATAGAAGELVLYLPREAVTRGAIAPGAVVAAVDRPYGVEFAVARSREPFFLAMTDDWLRELPARPISL